MASHADFELSLAYADIALGQIRSLHQPAYPRNYEVWYTYASGQNPQLNAAVNDALAKSGAISNDEIARIYEDVLSPQRFNDTADQIGVRVMQKVGQVLAMMQAAAGDASDFSDSLATASKAIIEASDDSAHLQVVVERLVGTTRAMEERNRALQNRLNESKTEITQLKENLEAVRTESLTDPLTTLSNRKYFDTAIRHLMADAALTKQPLSLLITDIDHFKNFNDTYGHLTGDQVLRLVALAVKQNVKGQDVAARYGGEEFVVLLPRTSTEQATTVAEHIRRAVMGKELMKRSTGESLGRITISIGVATMIGDETPTSLIERADSHLYAAKRAGRNRVSAALAVPATKVA